MSAERPDARPPGRLHRRGFWLLVAVGVLGGLAGVALVSFILTRWLTAPPSHNAPAGGSTSAAAPPGDERKIHAILFYVSDDGSELVQVSREVQYGATPVEQVRRLVEAQLEPAPAGMTSAVPAGTTLRSVFLAQHGDAYVDLSQEMIGGQTGGSLDEALAVYTIVDVVAVNLPDITAVQLLVNGKTVDSLAGHIDLRHPLVRSLRLIRKGQ